MSVVRPTAPAPSRPRIGTARAQPPPVRITGLDVARALAVVGMVVVNFRVVLTDGTGAGGALSWLTNLDGRAAAVFVVLAGIGASILGRGAGTGHAGPARRRLARRGAALLVLSVPLVWVWEAEILHVYAVFMVAGAVLVGSSTRTLAAAAGIALVAHAAVNLVADYRVPAGFTTFDTDNLGVVFSEGLPRALLFDGHYPLTPWLGLFLVGMLLGRAPLDGGRARTMVVAGLALTVLTEAVTRVVGGAAASEAVQRAVDRGPVPPSPVFVLAALGAALAVIGGSILVCERWPASRMVGALAAGGRWALTLYVAHLVIGLGVPAALGAGDGWGLAAATGYALAASALGIAACAAWRARHPRGPLEGLLRRLAGERALTGRSG